MAEPLPEEVRDADRSQQLERDRAERDPEGPIRRGARHERRDQRGVDVPVEQERVDVEDDERPGQERDEAVHVGDRERGPAGQPRPAREKDTEQHTAGEQRIRDDARGASGVPVDRVHDVWVVAGGLPPDDGARKPPPSWESSSSEPSSRVMDEEELPVDCGWLRVDDTPVTGCPCRASARTTAKPAAAARATARFAARARLRPASTLVVPGMSP
jgi:hypothetical protein